VNIMFGNGDGTFSAGQSYPSGGFFTNQGVAFVNKLLAVDDFNRDGNDDLAIVSTCLSKSDCSTGVLRILLGRGDGTFRVAERHAAVGHLAKAVTVGDFNGDGKADIAITNYCASSCSSGAVNVLLGNGNGTLQPAQSYLSGGIVGNSAVVGDFNRDGNLDLLVANASSTGLLLGNGNGTFQAAQAYNAGGLSVVVGDFNHDGRLDTALAGTIVLLNIGP
jgi:hypothetical protein